MLLFTFEKKGHTVYMPHLDILRAVIRTIRRAGLDVKYSEGFNPHMLLYFSPPLPLGTMSECEQCAAVTDESPVDFKKKYNAVALNGLKILTAETVAESNPARDIRAAEYEIAFKGADKLPFKDILSAKNLYAVYTDKDGLEITKDIRESVYLIENAGKDKIRCVVKAGNENLRADRLAKAAAGFAGIDLTGLDVYITRTKLFNEVTIGK